MSSMNSLSSSSALGASSAAKPTPSAPPTPNANPSTPHFAHWLQQSSQALQQDDGEPQAQPKDKPATKAAESRPAAKPAAKAAQASDAPEASTADPSLNTQASDEASGSAETSVAEDESSADTAQDNPAQQILAMLRGDAPAERSKPQADTAESQDSASEDSGLGRTDTRRGHAAARQAELRQEQQAARDQDTEALASDADHAPAQATDVGGTTALSGPLHAGMGSEAGARPMALPGDAGSFQALLAQAQQTPAPGAAAASSAQTSSVAVPLNAALHSAQFAPELSASLTLLVQDGVQQAQLHLNPAEMGPVAVQIQLDGQQAQISFHAEQAETRQVLERSLPELAAALQAQGLTLSGGGVFQQSGDPTQSGSPRGEPGSAAARSRDGDAQASALPPLGGPPPRQARGLVDLYA